MAFLRFRLRNDFEIHSRKVVKELQTSKMCVGVGKLSTAPLGQAKSFYASCRAYKI